MSRSAFAARFKEVVGEAPLEYLTRWRMRKASQLLRGEDHKLADVASLVGYDSEGAFSKAFKRVLGVSPGVYRKHQ
jgi:AraC-like DNA-binding protein